MGFVTSIAGMLYLFCYMKIGFFDSGLGGLTILKAVREHMPHYDYVYFGDTKHLPYGGRVEEEIYALAHDGVEKLFAEGAQIVIVACNTVSAESLRRLQDDVFNDKYPDRRVLGVIIPTVETLVEIGATDVLLIATERTVHSEKYPRELKKITDTITLTSMATPELVPKIEAHDFDDALVIAHGYIGEAMRGVDTLVLGCTHYTMLKEDIRARYEDVRVVSQDEIIPAKLEAYLQAHPEIERTLTHAGEIQIILSEDSERYERIKKIFFGV